MGKLDGFWLEECLDLGGHDDLMFMLVWVVFFVFLYMIILVLMGWQRVFLSPFLFLRVVSIFLLGD